MNLNKLRSFTTIEWMLVLLLLVAPLYFHPNLGGTGLRIPNNIIIWIVGSAIGFYSLFKVVSNQHLYLPRFYLLILAFPVLAWFSGMFSGIEIAEQWVFRLLYIWGGVLFLFALFQYRFKQGHFDRLLFVLLFSGLLHSIVGFIQIILVKDIPQWLPFNPSGMPTGLFQHINNQASFQVTIIIIGLWLITRPFIRRGPVWRFVAVATILACSAFIVSYSGSRVGALGFILALPLLLASRWHFVKADKKYWSIMFITLIIAISSATLVQNKLENKRGLGSVIDKTTAINSGYSGTARLGIYNISLELVKQKPVFGHGIGSFVRTWQYGKPAFYQQHPDAVLPPQRVSHPHNETIFWLVEGGLVAACGLLLLLIGVLVTLSKLPVCRRYAYAAFLLPIAIHTQVELPFYISANHWFVFLFILAIVLAPTTKAVTINLSLAATKLIQFVAIVAGFISLVFLAHSFAVTKEIRSYLLKEETKTPFPLAQQNPYFKALALDLMMVGLYEGSMRYDMKDNIKLIAEWAEEAIVYNPHILYFQLSVDAYINLKQDVKACTLARKGNAIYPTDEKLKSISQNCDEYGIH